MRPTLLTVFALPLLAVAHACCYSSAFAVAAADLPMQPVLSALLLPLLLALVLLLLLPRPLALLPVQHLLTLLLLRGASLPPLLLSEARADNTPCMLAPS